MTTCIFFNAARFISVPETARLASGSTGRPKGVAMRLDVLAVNNPFYAPVDALGHFTLSALPMGWPRTRSGSRVARATM